MKPQTVIMLVIASFCGLVAMIMTQRMIAPKDGAKVEMIKVIVAAGPIQAGARINDTMIKTIDYDKSKIDSLPKGFKSDPKDVIDRSLKFPVEPNEIISDNRLADPKAIGIEALIPSGMRAVTCAINTDRAIAGFIKPGSSIVDIILNTQSRGKVPSRSRTILQKVRVIGVGTEMINDPGGAQDTKGRTVDMVTFCVTPNEAEILNAATGAGQISLMLRNPVDTDTTKSKGISADDLLSGKSSVSDDVKTPSGTVLSQESTEKPQTALGNILAGLLKKDDPAADPTTPAPVDGEPGAAVVADDSLTPPPQVAQVAPPVRKKRKVLIYRNVRGEELMRVVMDADHPIVKSLGEIAADARDEEIPSPLPAPADNGAALPPAPADQLPLEALPAQP